MCEIGCFECTQKHRPVRFISCNTATFCEFWEISYTLPIKKIISRRLCIHLIVPGAITESINSLECACVCVCVGGGEHASSSSTIVKIYIFCMISPWNCIFLENQFRNDTVRDQRWLHLKCSILVHVSSKRHKACRCMVCIQSRKEATLGFLTGSITFNSNWYFRAKFNFAKSYNNIHVCLYLHRNHIWDSDS